MKIARTCTLWLVLYLVLAGLAGALVYERFPRTQPALIGGLAGGFFVWIALAYVAGIRTKGVEARQLRKAIEGGGLEDGQRVAVAGTVTGSIDFLESPITRKRCLAYEYKAVPPGNQQLGAWQGFALVPTMIHGPSGVVRILAAPELDFAGEDVGSREHMRNFREYIAKTTFTEHTGVDFKRDFAHLKMINADDDGRIRDDVHSLDRTDVENMTLSEKTLAAGERVVAYGRYSAARGGLVPDDTDLVHSVKIVKGEADALLRKVSRSRPFDLVKGCGCMLPVLIAAIVGILAVPLTAIEEMFPEKDPSWAEVRIEQRVRGEVKKAGLLPIGTTVIELELGAARGKLTWHGATSHWQHASAAREGEDVNVTISGDAPTLTARFHKDGTLAALNVASLAAPVGEVMVEQMDITESEIRGRVTYLTPKNEPSLRVAFHALLTQ